MRNWISRGLLVAGLLVAMTAHAKVTADAKDTLKTLTTIGDALDSPDHHPVHILYVHGIDEIGAGDSALLRDSICTKLNLCATSDWKNAGVEFPDKGEFTPGAQPPSLNYLGNPVWNNAEEWRAAAPFVVHWVVHLRNHPATLVVDEINWWPLVLAIKCRHIVATEPYLSGPNRPLLQVCSKQSMQDPDGLGHFFPWISGEQAEKLAAVKPRGVLVNRSLKDGLVDWGLSDVVLVVSPIGGILRDAIRQLMAKSAAFDPSGVSSGGDARGRYDWRAQMRSGNTIDQEFIGVAHSLGGYLLFNTLNAVPAVAGTPAAEAARTSDENNAIEYIFERASLFYFFANQLEMLEITNLDSRPAAAATADKTTTAGRAATTATAPAANFRELVERWQQIQSSFQAAVHPGDAAARKKIQVVAWSDPSDVLTWRVPRIGSVDVINLYVQNAPHWFWLFELPTSAHGNYAQNKDVLRIMFENSKPLRHH